MDAYGLFARERGWRVEKVLVISPYVEGRFFEELLVRLRPRHLHVVVDDGCRDRDLNLIKGAVDTVNKGKKTTRLHLRQASSPGLVHAKLFYIVEKSSTGRLRQSMVYGSGNATQQAFSGSINAEAIAKRSLTQKHHSKALQWFEDVLEGTMKPDRVKIEPAPMLKLIGPATINLPGFGLIEAGPKIGSFDLWLQRGRLLSIYRPEPTFLTTSIVLKKPLPAADLARKTERAGFRTPKRKQLRYPYIVEADAVLDLDEEDSAGSTTEGQGNWRRKYFTWTQLGDWCGEDCYRDLQQDFVRKGHNERQEAVDSLLTLRDKKLRKDVRARFSGAIDTLWSAYGEQASEYITEVHGEPDYSKYLRDLERKIERDLAWAQDDEFADRFVRGFELLDVPRFRTDSVGWEDFALSLCRQILIDVPRTRRTSMLARTLVDLCDWLDIDVDAMSPRELLDTLRSRWKATRDKDPETFGDYLAKYHSYWS